MSWLEFFWMNRGGCEGCPGQPKTELVSYAKAFFTNEVFEYGEGCNGTTNYGREQGKWTEQELRDTYKITDQRTIDHYKNEYKYYDEKVEIDCWALIDSKINKGVRSALDSCLGIVTFSDSPK